MCVCGVGRGWIRGMVSVCHHYGTSDCQAVSRVSQAFCSSFSPLCPICLSSLYPPSLFPGSCLDILSVFRLLLRFLFHPSIHLSVPFLFLALPSRCAVTFSFTCLHFSLNASLLQSFLYSPQYVFLCTPTRPTPVIPAYVDVDMRQPYIRVL